MCDPTASKIDVEGRPFNPSTIHVLKGSFFGARFMARVATNKTLQQARKAKSDECYTRFADIEKEIGYLAEKAKQN